MRTIRTKVYQFSELSEQAKAKALTILYKDEKRLVEITDHYEYSSGLTGLKGIMTRITDQGANIFLSVNLAGKYEDSLFWFPFTAFKPVIQYEFKADGTRF